MIGGVSFVVCFGYSRVLSLANMGCIKMQISISVCDKSGVLLETLDRESLEPFLTAQEKERSRRVAIGLQRDGACLIIQSKTDMQSLAPGPGEVVGELLVAEPVRKRQLEVWKCV